MAHEHRQHGHGEHDHNHQGHGDHGDHGHGGHARDQGLKGAIRYLKRAPDMWRSEINDIVVDLVDPQPGETIVDIGAGMGPGSVAVVARGASAVAIEPTPFLRQVLQSRRLLQRGKKRFSVSDGSAEQTGVPDASADAIFAVNSMHHWVDPDLSVAEIARVLKDGGRVVLVDEDFEDPVHPDNESFRRRHGGGDSSEDGPVHRHGFSMIDADQMGSNLTAAGLTNVKAAKISLRGRPAIVVTAGPVEL